jgi:NAD(P)-dependent dehydrogenase (short-subunit alcohol dehydrogenase family)
MNNALITNASDALSLRLAKGLAKHGWQVCILDSDRYRLDDMRFIKGVIPHAIDLTDRDELIGLIKEFEADLVIHAPAFTPSVAHFCEASESDIDVRVELDYSTTLHIVKSAIASMQQRSARGQVYLILPEVTHLEAVLERSIYSALVELMTGLQQEAETAGIRTRILSERDEEALMASIVK